MIRYRLRTLLILMAVAGLVFTRIGYLKRMGDFHRREVASLTPTIAMTEGEDDKRVAMSIKDLADGSYVAIGSNRVIFLEKEGGVFGDVSPSESLNTAVLHEVIANRYDRAMYRPWTVVSEAPVPPNEPPLFRFTIRESLLLMLLVALCVGWRIEHRRSKSAAALQERIVPASPSCT